MIPIGNGGIKVTRKETLNHSIDMLCFIEIDQYMNRENSLKESWKYREICNKIEK